MDALATAADAATYGYTLPDGEEGTALLTRASARVRRAAGNLITAAEVTVRRYPEAGRVVLPGAPILTVTSVDGLDEHGEAEPEPVAGWWFDGVQRVYGLECVNLAEVVYTVGYDPVPDGVVELVCSVAARMAVPVPEGVGAGLRSRTVGQVSATWSDEVTTQATADLLPAEKRALDAALSRRRAWVVQSR